MMNEPLTASHIDNARIEGNEIMRAARIVAPGEFEIIHIQRPSPAQGQVRVKISGCGLCSSSLPLWEGREWFSYPAEPGAPGHEAWGTIDALGEDVQGFEIGQPVAFLSYHSYADYDLVDSTSLIKLPPEMSDRPFLAEPLACAINIFKRSDILKGHTVAILGIGFLGALLIQLAKHAGASVIAISRRDYSLELAKANGADEVIAMDDHYKIIDKVKNLTNGELCDRVIEATGKEWPLNLAGELTKIRGRLMIAGFHQDGMRSCNIQLWNWRGLDVINTHERDPQAYLEGMKEALKAVSENALSPEKLYSHTFSLDEISKAFRFLKDRPEGFVKAIITM